MVTAPSSPIISSRAVKPWLFKKGQSGNPKGRLPIKRDCYRLIKDACPDAIRTLTELLNSDKASYRIQAAATLLTYGISKPAQALDVSTNQRPDVVNVVFLDQVNANQATVTASLPDRSQQLIGAV